MQNGQERPAVEAVAEAARSLYEQLTAAMPENLRVDGSVYDDLGAVVNEHQERVLAEALALLRDAERDRVRAEREKRKAIERALRAGATHEEVARAAGVSRQRVGQVGVELGLGKRKGWQHPRRS